MKTTRIVPLGVWCVPHGFGATYKRTASNPATPAQLSDMLALVGYEASAEVIGIWPLRKRVEAEVHAANEHLRANDNPIRRHPRPKWMPEPWKGPERSTDALYDGPTGTELT